MNQNTKKCYFFSEYLLLVDFTAIYKNKITLTDLSNVCFDDFDGSLKLTGVVFSFIKYMFLLNVIQLYVTLIPC